MRFEKVNENKLKIILSNNELPNSDSLDELMSNSDIARGSFFDLLQEANEAVGFNTSNYKVKIDAKAMFNGDFIFTITKLVKVHNEKVVNHADEKVVVRPRKVLKGSSTASVYSAYKFESFDDFCSFCSFLKLNKINYLKSFSVSCKFYKYIDKYYLVFEKINEKYKYLAKFYTSITEFSKYYSSKELFVSALNEHGELLIENNAILICQKYFI